MNRLLLAALAALVLASPAFAAAPRTISYQGILTQPGGAPVTNGNYSLTVRLYDVANGGAALYTETHPSVAVALGGFNVLVGSVTPLTLSFDRPLWLSLQVGADPELSPRVALASSPYSLGLSLPFAATENAGASPLVSLRNTGAGAALQAEGRLDLGSTNQSGRLELRAAGSASVLGTITPFLGYGGQMTVNDETGGSVVRMEPDINGSGGFFTVERGDGFGGFMVDGNSSGNNPFVSINGLSRSASFDMSQAGDPAVALPSSCISSLEQSNEAGVARTYSNSAITVGLGVTTITSRTITVPDDGYVIVTGNGHFEYGHVNGTDSRCLFSVNDQTGVFSNQIDATGLPSGAATGNYRASASMTGVWPVTAGAHTFYLLAQRIGAPDGAILNDPSITILYVPTAYGTVTTSKMASPAARSLPTGPAIDADLAAEQREAKEFDRARLMREMQVMQARLESLRRQLDDDAQTSAAANR